MRWFSRRKPRDLIAESTVEWETQRDAEQHEHDLAQLERVIANSLRDPRRPAEAVPLIASGGWCAPSTPDYLQLPEIQIRRGGIKWPTN